jgi:hypothetical protein
MFSFVYDAVNDKLEGNMKESLVTYFKMLSYHFLRRDYRKPQSGKLASKSENGSLVLPNTNVY